MTDNRDVDETLADDLLGIVQDAITPTSTLTDVERLGQDVERALLNVDDVGPLEERFPGAGHGLWLDLYGDRTVYVTITTRPPA